MTVSFREIADLLRYDPVTGLLYWRGGPRRRPDGTPAGSLNADGYLRVTVKYKRYPAHRLAWLLVRGEWPERDLDHINGNRSDNRISNLRPCTDQQNQRNRKPMKHTHSGGLKGAIWDKRIGRWHARIKVDSRAVHLGTFDTPHEAHERYAQAAIARFGEFARSA